MRYVDWEQLPATLKDVVEMRRELAQKARCAIVTGKGDEPPTPLPKHMVTVRKCCYVCVQAGPNNDGEWVCSLKDIELMDLHENVCDNFEFDEDLKP